MGRFAVALVIALPLLAVPALAAGPGKRFAHNRGTWTGSEPIEVVGHVSHPRSIAVRVRWRTLQPAAAKPHADQPEASPDVGATTGTLSAAAAPIPGEGIAVKWRLTCPLGNTRAARRTGLFTAAASPEVHSLPLPRSGLPLCLVLVDAEGPSGTIGTIMLDLYART
jgi:hypothetical protein